MELDTSFLGLMQKDIKNRQALGLLPKRFSSFIFTFAMWECADQQQLQLKSLKGLRVKYSLRNHYATQKSSLGCLCLPGCCEGTTATHTSWIKLFWEYRTLTSTVAHILPSCLICFFFFIERLVKKKKKEKKTQQQNQWGKREKVSVWEPSIRQWKVCVTVLTSVWWPMPAMTSSPLKTKPTVYLGLSAAVRPAAAEWNRDN